MRCMLRNLACKIEKKRKKKWRRETWPTYCERERKNDEKQRESKRKKPRVPFESDLYKKKKNS